MEKFDLELLTENGLYEIPFKSKTANKRGVCYNYHPIALDNQRFEQIRNLALRKTDIHFQQLVKDEFETLTKNELSSYELNDFKKRHSFWTKEEENLLVEYRLLYFNFVRRFINSKPTSKNIISCADETCITSLQFHDGDLYVTQRSCDMSCGFFADALTISHFAEYTKAKRVYWIIQVPHVYENNYKKTLEYYKDIEAPRPRFNFNVR